MKKIKISKNWVIAAVFAKWTIVGLIALVSTLTGCKRLTYPEGRVEEPTSKPQYTVQPQLNKSPATTAQPATP